MGVTKDTVYRKNFLLIVSFIGLISVLFIFALSLGYNFTKKYIENEFASAKIEVLERSIKPYNDLFLNKIPEISFYNGYLDYTSAAKYSQSVLSHYEFVRKIVFYDAEISNIKTDNGVNVGHFSFGPKAVYQYGYNIPHDSVTLFSANNRDNLSLKTGDDFHKLAVKLAAFVDGIDTSQVASGDEVFNTFYNVSTNKIGYMNVPRLQDLRIYQDLMHKKLPPSPGYRQDVFVFNLDPHYLKIVNSRPSLYEKVIVKPLGFDPVDLSPNNVTTDISLPGAFSDYKLYFVSSKSFLKKEMVRMFLPIAAGLLALYAFLMLVAFLIFRNLNINSKLFKLQYDFINNLTHEFKTPVSVIKIAGNNIRSAVQLSDKERSHYGRILDEEADKLNDLMNKLLSYTQIENKAIKLKEETIDLNLFCSNIADTYALKYPTLKLTYEIINAVEFITDPVLFGSLFANLIDNAYKYAQPDRKVLHISIKQMKSKLVLRFTDQGIGIPDTELNNIFKKFYRIQNQYNQQGSVGLGLAFCKELVNFMQGDISVWSKVGKGTEFKIVLPYLSKKYV